VAVWVAIALGRRYRLDWSLIGWLTLIAGTSWVILIFKGIAITVLAPLRQRDDREISVRAFAL
jgi:hypothetical protein